ncbi:DUF6814 family protein [Fluviicola taffensis]|uniref:Uncharacterized protein n=1 Tax=Fluviicola taffensis (strain DSM 16823 / NCIMB 13979 / RW262) TaxID=755732 RepID=F2IHC4_FLUTR|nr:hypothetical protein [Fluviicola taffensis]AEA42679.1 hypothetical protein Fluta_0675 [Fluviicola taffensis DSM 16823]
MNIVKRVLGVVWLLLAALSAYFCVMKFGLPKFSTGSQDDLVFGIIILCILTPLIVLGLAIFGVYALKGEYDDEK